MRLVQLENGVKARGISSSQYVKATVENVESFLREKGKNLDKTARTPIRTSYSPELDVSAELGPQESSYYQSLIGVLNGW